MASASTICPPLDTLFQCASGGETAALHDSSSKGGGKKKAQPLVCDVQGVVQQMGGNGLRAGPQLPLQGKDLLKSCRSIQGRGSSLIYWPTTQRVLLLRGVTRGNTEALNAPNFDNKMDASTLEPCQQTSYVFKRIPPAVKCVHGRCQDCMIRSSVVRQVTRWEMTFLSGLASSHRSQRNLQCFRRQYHTRWDQIMQQDHPMVL
ncbi:hypothetical protein MPH_00535 [Macrophomina phaseolina MS6]|uniref:Uncharacterized protein n=1 Tax=Macrophomina phaseolina (strain MS6) TaxID=1126212 RepID=K2SZL5_MACPH|nr:hypothetical protein MPH_00535 [Macrophomina phaseolina MS6]